jgi:hypothetical protein
MSNQISFNHLNTSSQADPGIEMKTMYDTIQKYRQILDNTAQYRTQWAASTKTMIAGVLQELLDEAKLPNAQVVLRENVENLEAVVLDLGRTSSGITEKLDDSGVLRQMLKSNGSLFYQQLYNGKIIAMMLRPFIEGYGQPQPPLNLEILRPDEINKSLILRHLEIFFNDITSWEDFDDDAQRSNIGFNPIGFHTSRESGEHS